MELQWGSRIIEAIKELDGQNNVVVLVRHSERPSFDGIPVEQWNSVLLTERGIETAKQFGMAVTTDGAVKDLRVHSWGLKRCVMTADAISIGALEAGSNVNGPTPIQLQSPILEHKEYQKEVGGIPWDRFVYQWLQATGQKFGMMQPSEFSKVIFRMLRREKLSAPDGVTLIATHDLHIIPLIDYTFHVKQPWIDYLDGVALKMNHDKIAVSYAGKIRNIGIDELES